MVPVTPFSRVGTRGVLAAILVLAALIRMPQIPAPLADNLQIKQVYVSNKGPEYRPPAAEPVPEHARFPGPSG